MDKPLYLFVGKSASGKTTIAEMLEQKYGYKQVQSYTTRPHRYEGEIGHIFVTEKEFMSLGNVVAYTFYNSNHYGTTSDQLDECDIYVVDIPGVETLLQNYKTDRPICVFYFDATVYARIMRMLERHDSDMNIISRLLQDEKLDWYHQLDSLVWRYSNILGKNVEMHSINANGSESVVLDLVLHYVNQYMGDN